jgi:hypothetical protein
MTACVLLAWLRLLALDGDLTRAEPKTLRYRVLHAAARLVRRRAATMAENRRGLALGRGDHDRVAADRNPAASTLTTTNPSRRARKKTPGPWNPRPPGPTAGLLSYPDTKIRPQEAARHADNGSLNPDERSGLGVPIAILRMTTRSLSVSLNGLKCNHPEVGLEIQSTIRGTSSKNLIL